jgi:hypothetical protein
MVTLSWLAETLRHYPEIAVFLSLGIGYRVGGKSFKGFSLSAVMATTVSGHCDWAASHYSFAQPQVGVLPDVSVRRGLRGRAAVCAWYRERRPA